MTPFQALFGRTPLGIPDYIPGSTHIPTLDNTLQNRQQILQSMFQNLKRIRQSMRDHANRKRKHCTFREGSWVLLRLRLYRQHTVQHRSSQKLSKRYFGPFKVLRRNGEAAYHLDLPVSSTIHPVFHVSLLRAYHGTEPLKHFVPLDLSNTDKDLLPTLTGAPL